MNYCLLRDKINFYILVYCWNESTIKKKLTFLGIYVNNTSNNNEERGKKNHNHVFRKENGNKLVSTKNIF